MELYISCLFGIIVGAMSGWTFGQMVFTSEKKKIIQQALDCERELQRQREDNAAKARAIIREFKEARK